MGATLGFLKKPNPSVSISSYLDNENLTLSCSAWIYVDKIRHGVDSEADLHKIANEIISEASHQSDVQS